VSESYPRDMIGYGRNPPHPKWPNGARIAVQFVINDEEGAENNILHGDPASESLLTEFGFVPPRQGERYLPVESQYEYGSRVGFWRLHRLFTSRNVPITVFGVAMALSRNPDAVAAMLEADWEIASHGYRWIDHHGMPEAEEREHIKKTIELHTEVTGTRPLGHFLGRRSENTLRLIAEEGAQSPRLMNIGLHCRLVGRPGRFQALKKFVEHVESHDDVWLCRGIDIARHWRRNFPPTP